MLNEWDSVVKSIKGMVSFLEDESIFDAQRLLTHPLPHWVERMTVSYLKAHGGQAERRSQSWNLTWPGISPSA